MVPLKCKKNAINWSCTPDATGEITPLPSSKPLTGGEGAGCPSPRTYTSALGLSGLGLRPFRFHCWTADSKFIFYSSQPDTSIWYSAKYEIWQIGYAGNIVYIGLCDFLSDCLL